MRIQCPNCSKPFDVPEAYAGKKAKCSDCKSSFVVNKVATASQPTSAAANASLQTDTSPVPSPTHIPRATTPPATNAKPQERPSPKVDGKEEWSNLDFAARQRLIMQGFVGEFARPKTSAMYRLGLFASAAVMLLLPLLYLLFIVAIGGAVWWHLMNNGSVVQSARGRAAGAALMLYLAPAVVGVIAIVFMFKPIFARPAKKGRSRSLTEKGEPILFEFVRHVCSEVGAPMPKRIDIDNEVNASASFRMGWWSILRGNDLVLTLGMPLVSGLSLQQLAGVLAHEFGHFSQGAGMRVSYILRSINLWFVRAVYERDTMDEWLSTASSSLDLRISWVLYLARFAVYLSRWFLYGLLLLGNLLTGFIQQQMEFDADRYEVGMAGKKTFASTFLSLRVIGIAYGQAMETLSRIFSEGRLLTNISSLTQFQLKKLPSDVVKKIEVESLKVKTGWFDSHPSDSKRIEAVTQMSDQGAFQSSLPAQALFVHFDAACEGVTSDMYKAVFGDSYVKTKIVPTSDVIQEETVEDKAWEALNRFFCESITPSRSFPLPSYSAFCPPDYDHAVQNLQTARQWASHSVEHYKTLMDRQEFATKKQRNEELAARFRRRHSKMKADLLKLDPADIPTSSIATPDIGLADKFVQASTIRLHTACCLLHHEDVASAIENGAALQSRVMLVMNVLATLEADLPKVVAFQDAFYYQSFCLYHLDSNNSNQDMLIRDILENSQTLVDKISELRRGWLSLKYPFEHADPTMTIGKHVATDILIPDEVGAVANAAEMLIERYFNLRGRCLGHLSIAAEEVERALGLPPVLQPKTEIAPPARPDSA